MSNKLEVISPVKDGRLLPKHSGIIAKWLTSHEGKSVSIVLDKHSGKRTARQNSLWWLYCTILANELGYDKQELHEILKMKFLKKSKVDEATGEVFEYLGTTTALSKTEFSEMIEGLIKWASQTFNVVLPPPATQIEVNLTKKET